MMQLALIWKSFASVHHLSDNLALNRAVFEILTVEVLRSIAHSMARVTHYWQFHFALVW